MGRKKITEAEMIERVNTIINCLRNERVIVRFIPKETAMIHNKNHILCGHMELQTCKRFLRTIYSEQLQSIGLIHLSQVNGDPDRFLNEVQDEFPFTHVWVAEKNKRIEV